MEPVAAEPTLRRAPNAAYMAAYTTRNWTFTDQVSRQQIHDVPVPLIPSRNPRVLTSVE